MAATCLARTSPDHSPRQTFQGDVAAIVNCHQCRLQPVVHDQFNTGGVNDEIMEILKEQMGFLDASGPIR